MVDIVVVFQIIVTCDLKSKVRETGFCSMVGLFRISESCGWQSESVLSLS